MKRLALGSGLITPQYKAEGWHTLDGSAEHAASFEAILPPLPEVVMAERWDVIEGIHIIEHFYKWDARDLISQCYECLVDGGKLVLECPNLDYVIRVMAGQIEPPRHPEDQRHYGFWALYGLQHDEHREPLQTHKYNYTPSTLTDLVVEAGFEREKVSTMRPLWHMPARDLRLEAVK